MAVFVFVAAGVGLAVGLWWGRRTAQPQPSFRALERMVRHASVLQRNHALSHDVRNGLVGVLGNAQLGEQVDDVAELRSYLHEVETAALQLSADLKEALERLRLPPVVLADQPLRPIIDHALAARADELRGVVVAVHMRDERASVDAPRLSAALACLFENGANVSKANGRHTLTIDVTHSGSAVVISVVDSGRGFDAAVLSRPFRAVPPSGGALGVGLSSANVLLDGFADVSVKNAPSGSGCVSVTIDSTARD